jgi:hypothetical protein
MIMSPGELCLLTPEIPATSDASLLPETGIAMRQSRSDAARGYWLSGLTKRWGRIGRDVDPERSSLGFDEILQRLSGVDMNSKRRFRQETAGFKVGIV